MYESITRGVKVSVRPQYLDSQSKPEEGHYVWSYTITIENHGRETVTLRTRYWKITDATGTSRRSAAPASSASSRHSSPVTATATRAAAP